MSTKSHEQVLNLFEPIGLIFATELQSGSKIIRARIDAEPGRPGVYAWVEEEAGERSVLYIGKAGTTITARHKAHNDGFRRSLRGKGHAMFLLQRLNAGAQISVWGLWPGSIEMFGGQVPLHSAVEDFLLSVIEPKPIRNREARSTISNGSSR